MCCWFWIPPPLLSAYCNFTNCFTVSLDLRICDRKSPLSNSLCNGIVNTTDTPSLNMLTWLPRCLSTCQPAFSNTLIASSPEQTGSRKSEGHHTQLSVQFIPPGSFWSSLAWPQNPSQCFFEIGKKSFVAKWPSRLFVGKTKTSRNHASM